MPSILKLKWKSHGSITKEVKIHKEFYLNKQVRKKKTFFLNINTHEPLKWFLNFSKEFSNKFNDYRIKREEEYFRKNKRNLHLPNVVLERKM